MRLIFIVVAISSLVLGGCTSDWREGYTADFTENTPIATTYCQQYGQIYMAHYYNIQDSSWHVICKQKSPEKLIDKKVTVSQ